MAYYSSSNRKLERFFQILVIVVCAALLITGIVAIANAFKTHDGYSDVNLKYKVGEIVSDSTGSGVVSAACKTALYSTDAVRCTGYYLKTSFDPRYDFEVHYYTEDNVYIGFVTKSDITYHVDVGDMPVLKSFVGNLEDAAYENAEIVNDSDGNKQVATYIRIVIRSMSGDEDIFDNYATRKVFANSLELRVTTRGESDNTVSSPK